jgi:hypothetical protein
MADPMPQWEYRVIHINVESTGSTRSAGPAGSSASPQKASEHLHGALSPSFIAREFPEHYSAEQGSNKPKNNHPTEQLQHFLNQLGKDGWEMTTTAQVGPLLMFFFKRPVRPLPKLITAAETGESPEAP